MTSEPRTLPIKRDRQANTNIQENIINNHNGVRQPSSAKNYIDKNSTSAKACQDAILKLAPPNYQVAVYANGAIIVTSPPSPRVTGKGNRSELRKLRILRRQTRHGICIQSIAINNQRQDNARTVNSSVQVNGAVRTTTLSSFRDMRGYITNPESEHHTEQPGRMYLLAEVAEKVELPKQNILNIIERHGLIQPKEAKYGKRPAYGFSDEDIAKIQEVKRLRGLGYSYKDIIEFMEDENSDAYTQIAHQLSEAIQSWYTAPSEDSWHGLVDVLAQIPTLTDQEKYVLSMTQRGHSLSDCGSRMGLLEGQVVDILREARNKIGQDILRLLSGNSRG